jgi:(1->4)-alpha-D-glucan 1-alpha-D-glucosylmutase
MENSDVFDEYHRLIKQLYDEGLIHGVRIDHIDGLQDPSGYVKRLRTLLGPACYIIAEKILEAKESMPEDWPIEGTSGYEFLSHVSQLMTDREGARKLVDFYHELVPHLPPYQKLVLENKRRILEHHMHGEWENLVNEFTRLKLANGYTHDAIKNALGAVMVSLPVYRIYPNRLPLEGAEKKVMDEAFQKAAEQSQPEAEQVRYLEQLMVNGEEQETTAIIKFEKRLMQYTGPLTAKGVEDTTFYVYNPLISHDEVGDAPSTLGISINAFHSRMLRRLKENPLSLNATATHDTKRGEDARLRLNVISEIPDTWIRYVREWMALNKPLRNDGEDPAPSVNDEYFVYQSLIGGMLYDSQITDEFVERV